MPLKEKQLDWAQNIFEKQQQKNQENEPIFEEETGIDFKKRIEKESARKRESRQELDALLPLPKRKEQQEEGQQEEEEEEEDNCFYMN